MGGVHEQNWLSIKKSSPQEEDMYLKTLSGVLELKSTQMYICESLDKKKLGLSHITNSFAAIKNNEVMMDVLFLTVEFLKAHYLGIYEKTLTREDTCTPIFLAAPFVTAKLWKQQPKCPSTEWVKKMCYICVYTHTDTHGDYCSLKKNEILPFIAARMDLKGIRLKEVSLTEKDTYPMISLICGI